MIKCVHCGRYVVANPRVKNQRYCSDRKCQKARKAKWQREKLASDPDYRANQEDARCRWRRSNRDYWRKYREANPGYKERNRQLQRKRDIERRYGDLANMDALKPGPVLEFGAYYLCSHLANMDASSQKVILIPIS